MTFENVGDTAQATWQPIDSELEKIEDQLRQGSINSLTTLDAFLEKLKQEIRYSKD